MKISTVEACRVQVCDRIYWAQSYHRDKWVFVLLVEDGPAPNCVTIHTGYGSTVKHAREGVAVRRSGDA